MNIDIINDIKEISKILSDEKRIIMLKLMSKYMMCTCHFVEIFESSEPLISQNIKKMKDLGIIVEENVSQWTYYKVNKKSKYYNILSKILKELPKMKGYLEIVKDNRCEVRKID